MQAQIEQRDDEIVRQEHDPAIVAVYAVDSGIAGYFVRAAAPEDDVGAVTAMDVVAAPQGGRDRLEDSVGCVARNRSKVSGDQVSTAAAQDRVGAGAT
ncbi:MAG: hypothetical protein OEX78_08485, partial [Betaproteobacteria bacterium]|nr:hypothetical protein [Betaproteobacteria bacterium]